MQNEPCPAAESPRKQETPVCSVKRGPKSLQKEASSDAFLASCPGVFRSLSALPDKLAWKDAA